MGEDESDPLRGNPKYRTVRELGEGGMGKVFEAEHVALGTRVVIKLLHDELATMPHLVDRMRLEAQALARLQHPHLVRVSDFDTTPEGRPYFVMEYLEGRSVKEEADARGGSLPEAEAVAIVRQALAGLAVAHGAGLLHRDIKLDNMVLCDAPDGVAPPGDPLAGRSVKLLDFGVAKVLAAGSDVPAPLAIPTDTGVVVGTPRFFAPEQARGLPMDHRADLYSMGLVLYGLLAGRGPFDHATTVAEMARAHAFDEPEPPSHFASQPVPPALDGIVLRCLHKDPAARFASAAELAAALERLHPPVTATEPLNEPKAATPDATAETASAATLVMVAPPGEPAGLPHAPTQLAAPAAPAASPARASSPPPAAETPAAPTEALDPADRRHPPGPGAAAPSVAEPPPPALAPGLQPAVRAGTTPLDPTRSARFSKAAVVGLLAAATVAGAALAALISSWF